MTKFLNLQCNAREVKSFLAKAHIVLRGEEIPAETAIKLIGMDCLKKNIVFGFSEYAFDTEEGKIFIRKQQNE